MDGYSCMREWPARRGFGGSVATYLIVVEEGCDKDGDVKPM